MSLLSQFFPSGGGGQKIEFLLTAGGGGGGTKIRSSAWGGVCAQNAGGGGGGQVVVGEDYEVVTGLSYPIVIGAGGAGGCLIPVGPYDCRAYGKPGSNGSNSSFGSVIARGGGGGKGSFNPSCITCVQPSVPNIITSGCPGGNGGGGATSPYCINVGTVGSAGEAIGVYPVGNTVKFGSPGNPSKLKTNLANRPNCPGDPGCGCYYATLAGGGGGSGGGGGTSFSGGTITLNGSCDWFLGGSTTCNCPYLPACWRGFKVYKTYSGSLATGGEIANTKNSVQKNDPLSAANAGGDGYLSSITGTDDYYGGGGEAFNGQAISGDRTGIAPSHPYYPSINPVFKYPNGSCGGGAYALRGPTAPVCNYYPGVGPWFFTTTGYYSAANPCSAPYYVVCQAVPGYGGGGLGGMAQTYAVNTTGPCASNQCLGDGTNGSGGSLIIRYPTAFAAATVSGNTPITPVPGFYIYKWVGPGSITFN